MTDLVVDTSVFIDWTRQRSKFLMKLVDLSEVNEVRLWLPTVVVFELWAGLEMNRKRMVANMEETLQPFELVELTDSVAKLAGELVRKKRVSQPIDAMIAATALEMGAEVASVNRKHFAGIPGLKVFGE